MSLWAAKRIKNNSKSQFAFPAYTNISTCKSNSASAALNKWMKARIHEDGVVVHSFRHSLRDRLRAVNCPFDVIDQIGGWQTAGVGQSYGNGYPLKVLHEWMMKLE
jgi:integrase